MKFFSLAALSVTALFSMVQYCPAPFAVVGPILGMTTEAITAADSVLASMASGAIAGGISAGAAKSKGGKGKRGVPAGFPPGVSEQAWQQCENQLKGAHIYLKGKPNNGTLPPNSVPVCAGWREKNDADYLQQASRLTASPLLAWISRL